MRRSSINIIAQILEAANKAEGITKTKIMYSSFLSYEQLKQYLQILADNVLLTYNEETQIFKTTDKGRSFLQIYGRIDNVIKGEQKTTATTMTTNFGAEREEENVSSELKAISYPAIIDRYKPKARLLVVDDDADITEVLKQGLQDNAFHVDAYTSSEEVLNVFKPNVYDLAILDIRMPGLDGFGLYRIIKKLDPAIAACFLSGFEIHPDEMEKMFLSLNEVNTIIKKPVSIHDLLIEIKPLLRISTIRRASKGEHLAVAFDTPQELIEQSLQFLKIGLLEKEEDILLVTDELRKDAIREKIITQWHIAEDVSSLEQEGRITLRSFAEWHLRDNRFDPKRSKAMMIDMAQKALDDGRKGLRFVHDGNSFISNGRKREQIIWESSLEKQFNLPITLLCAYSEENLTQLSNLEIMHAIQKPHIRIMTIEETADSGSQ